VIGSGTGDETGVVAYTLGLRALADRNYSAAPAYLAEAERLGLVRVPLRPLLAYSLCLAGNLDAARKLAPEMKAGDTDELHFWSWLESTFGLDS
jgi:hypothetical protein